MNHNRSIALVGRPNVGKSRLFNRLAKKRISIVHDQEGVTRDIVTAEINDDFLLMDTGGIGIIPKMTSEAIANATEEQVDFAIQAASIILFVVDAKDGLNPTDILIANKLRKFNKNTLLVSNKMDHKSSIENINDFHSLGFGDPIPVSAEHGTGTDTLLLKIETLLGPKPETKQQPQEDAPIKVSFIGRPNVGKSSLGNKLINSKRLIVSNVPGTTRETIWVQLDFKTATEEYLRFSLADTAGLKAKRKVDSSLDYFSSLRSNVAIENSDIVFLVLDAKEGVTKLDKKLAGDILDLGKCLIILVNKWDYAIESFAKDPIKGYDTEKDFRLTFEKAIRKELFSLPNSPILFTSAKKDYKIEEILLEAKKIYDTANKIFSTSKLNKVLGDIISYKEPRIQNGKRFKIYYAVQVDNMPYKIRIFCNHETYLEDTYSRYLESSFVNAFGLKGCPIKFEFVGKPKRYSS